MLWSGQGPVYVGKRDANGNAKGLRHIASCDVEARLQSQTVEHFESDTGQRLQDGRLILSKTASITLRTGDWDVENLALGFYSTSTIVTGSSVTAEQLPDPITQGEYFRFSKQDVSSVVIKDSAGTPATLVEGTDYEITSAEHGRGKIISDLSSYTLPLLADYDYADVTNLAIFDTAPEELWLAVDIVNTAASGNPKWLVEFFRVVLDPIGSANLKGNEYGELEMAGSILYDPDNAGDAALGGFGHMVQMA